MSNSDASNMHPTVLLVGNYVPDGQHSMQRFASQLAGGLQDRGIAVELIRPRVLIGRLGAAPHGIGKWLGYIDKFILFPFLLLRKLRTLQRPFVVHICDHSNACYTRWLRSVPHLVTCHDLLAVRSALGEIETNRVTRSGRILQSMILNGLRRSQAIVSVSAATRDDVSRIVGSRPDWSHVVENGLSDSFTQAARQAADPGVARAGCLLNLPTGSSYVLHVGGNQWYKNRTAVLRIFSELEESNPDLFLVFIGPRFDNDQIERITGKNLSARIRYLSGIDDENLQAIYAGAQMLIFPSLMEGFGWPILEAQACGCPVATLDRPPMNGLNAIPALQLTGDPDAPEWPVYAARQCHEFMSLPNAEKSLMKADAKKFTLRYSNDRAIDAYTRIYQTMLQSSQAE